jgi:pyridoxal phosphate enzyme (YggS family)
VIKLDTYRKLVTECSEQGVTLVTVSKDKPLADIQALYAEGQRLFGENRVQELTSKAALLPADIEWHLIGHLQTNKVKYVTPFVTMIQSIDSLKLLQEVDKRAAQNNRVIDCLLQVHIAVEESKFGFSENDLWAMISESSFQGLKQARVCGLMGIASLTDDQQQVRSEFRRLKRLFDEIKREPFAQAGNFNDLSMGMSSDYKLAIEEGSTMVRVGSLIFGRR